MERKDMCRVVECIGLHSLALLQVRRNWGRGGRPPSLSSHSDVDWRRGRWRNTTTNGERL